MKKSTLITGHLSALLTICVWALTYVSTKVLLQEFSATAILVIRIVVGYLALCALSPIPIKPTDKKQELHFALAGLTGVALYFLLQNIGLNLTTASNASVILSTASFFTAVFGILILRKKHLLTAQFLIGFVLAIAGISMISFSTQAAGVHLWGDLLTLLAATVWGLYSLLADKLSAYGYSNLKVTRRIFFYGVIFLLPLIIYHAPRLDYAAVIRPVNLFNLLFLGVIASAVCFLTWNYSVKAIGAVGTSAYIYFEPVVTVISSVFILNERLTAFSAIGIVLTLLGLVVSEYRKKKSQSNTI